jgi:cysteinyl-tRNA synthetase
MAIRLYDSLTRDFKVLGQREPGAPPISEAHPFAFYNCGPTVYAPAHIGNFRTFVINDVIRRLLELEFGPDKVKHVRNITDVDDKTIRRSQEEKRPLGDFTKQWADKFHADCAALNCLPPHEEPHAADPKYLREQVDMINVLLEKGNAYRAPDGSVYFKVSSFPGYGALSRVKERELQLGTSLKPQAADSDEKEDGSDFALWKAWKPEDGPNKWPGPAGAAEGRPGWHIECSAMSKVLLGETIDLHSGGVDLLFPHHENEIAQSECCNSTPGHHVQFSRHWYHSEHLLVDGKKMSKSLGNLYTLDDLRAKGFSPMALRYALLSGHHRKQLNFTLDSLHAAESALNTMKAFVEQMFAAARIPITELYSPAFIFGPAGETILATSLLPLRDDLNTPQALGSFFQMAKMAELGGAAVSKIAQDAARLLFIFGFDLRQLDQPKVDIPADITALAARRWAAKLKKDYAEADVLRMELNAAGWAMLDRKDGYSLKRLSYHATPDRLP